VRGLLRLADRLRRVYWFVRRPTTVGALGIVLDEDGRVLLVEHTYRAGWYLPGGGVKRGEGLDDAIRRELREEVGVEVVGEPRLLGVYWGFAQWKSDYTVVFTVERWRRTPVKSLEIARDAFFAPDEVPDTATPGTQRRIADFLAGGGSGSGPW
jgi:ADP-ribose pyrophosphatase YjhB (NUDIX family)